MLSTCNHIFKITFKNSTVSQIFSTTLNSTNELLNFLKDNNYLIIDNFKIYDIQKEKFVKFDKTNIINYLGFNTELTNLILSKNGK